MDIKGKNFEKRINIIEKYKNNGFDYSNKEEVIEDFIFMRLPFLCESGLFSQCRMEMVYDESIKTSVDINKYIDDIENEVINCLVAIEKLHKDKLVSKEDTQYLIGIFFIYLMKTEK